MHNGKRKNTKEKSRQNRGCISVFFPNDSGKYIHGNCQYLKDEGKPVPDSCFWMFRKNYLAPPYNERIYSRLFGMSAPELIEFYESHSDAEVRRFAKEKYKDWTKEDNDNLFVRR